jgi:hypothetical protein
MLPADWLSEKHGAERDRAGRAALQKGGYTDEGIAAVEKLMEEYGIPDHEAAASLHEKLQPPAEPVHLAAGFCRRTARKRPRTTRPIRL